MTTTPRLLKSLTQVNTSDGGAIQSQGHVAGLPGGGYVVVWADNSHVYNHNGTGIVGQRYDGVGNKVGGEVFISRFNSGDQLAPAVTVLSNGNVAVAFHNTNQPILGATDDVYVSVFDSSLNFIRRDSVDTGSNQTYFPSITALAGSAYAVSYTVGLSTSDIAGRIVDAAGNVGPQFNIDTQADNQNASQLATLSNGNFVAVYEDENGGNPADIDILVKIFTPAGTLVSGPGATPASADSGRQTAPDVAALRDGGFVMVWSDDFTVDGSNDIRAAVLSNTGSIVTDRILVTGFLPGDQEQATVVALGDGGFLVTWDDYQNNLVQAQRFDAAGHAIGSAFTVKNGAISDTPQAALLSDGRFAFAVGDTSTGDDDVMTSIWTTGWNAIAMGDFNHDSTKDVLWRNAVGSTAEWLMSPSGGIANDPATPAASGWNVIVSADLNGDGTSDLLWQQASTGATAEWLMSPNGGASLLGTPLVQGWNLITSSDFNGDGTTDLLWKHASSGATAEWLMSPNGGASLLGTPLVQGWNFIASGDFNRDGTTDLMWQQASSGATAEWLMSPNGGASLLGTPLAQGWNVIASGDLNGDGTADLMWQQASTGATAEWLMAPSGGANLLGTPAAQGWNVIASGDFNGDHITDLLWKNAASSATAEWLMAPTGGVGSLLSTPAVQGWNVLAIGDFNGDHITDVMWQQASTGATAEWLMAPTGGANLVGTPIVQGWDLVALGDFNGDAAVDLMWQNALTGATAEWLMAPGGGVGAFVSTLTM